ncbi:TetR/AcrR family transcriptional regulator [Alkaliphilus peptidifermentans]|uniref:Transcriptional regulator, TetR family n=1 Tax=Alkaliphilus peptidifermentans DSM 18978 TaxID=1120976 RepID=A0A1G5LCT9_9FIRM|nr:TetR/AcrR family transcriptional regulator [Alkaliphilus peptidifermentans]SCZ10727.1 transcriptional regulator, TetR family [Alkaliphilus peptidifermentans DSM 18978]
MQIKKDEIRLSILKEAEKEFLEKGFEGASLRKIVKAAGTTIGNFYNYFESKELLFEELVEEEYKGFIYFIKHHNNIERPDYLWETTDIGQWRSVLSEVTKHIIPVFTDKITLLIEGSKGTRFENTKEILLKLLKEHFIEHLERFKSDYIHIEIADIIAEQFLSGILLIMKKYKDEELRKQLITEHVLIYFIGTMGLMGEWK